MQPIRSTTQICIFFKEFLRSFLRHQRALYLRTRTATTSTRFNLKCFRIFSKNVQSFIVLFFTWKASAIIFMGDSLALSRSQNDWTCSYHYDILAKTRSRMTTATTFSRQNDAGSRASTTQYWENLVLVVVLVAKSKAVYHFAGKPVVEDAKGRLFSQASKQVLLLIIFFKAQ